MNQTQDHIHFWIQQQTRRLESSCHQAEQQIRVARTMRDVALAAQVTVPHELHAIRHTVPAYRQVETAAERRMGELLDAQLQEIKAAATEEEGRQLMGRFIHKDWQSLRGTYAHIYRRGEMEARRLLHQKKVTKE